MKYKNKKVLLITLEAISIIISTMYIYLYATGIVSLKNIDIQGMESITLKSQYISLTISAIFSILAIIFIAKNFVTNKKKIIVFNVLQGLFGSIINILIAIINVILLLVKTKDIEEEKAKKIELPVVKENKKYLIWVYLLVFLIIYIPIYTPVSEILPFNPTTMTGAIIETIFIYIIQLIILILLMKDEIKESFIVLKNNIKLYLKYMIPRFGIFIIACIFVNFILMFTLKAVPLNQQAISEEPKWLISILAIFIAPIIEELLFRGTLRKIMKNNVIFLIVSSVLFGYSHVAIVAISGADLMQYLFIIPYSILGCGLAYNYIKTKNISSNILLHSLWNFIGIIAMMFM